MTSISTAIRTWGLSKSYRLRVALCGVDLEVPARGVFGYLGPRRAGKTTTIRLLAGLLRPTTGRSEVFGLDALRYRERLRWRIGYLPGEFAAYPDLTGRQYLRYLASLRRCVSWPYAERLADRFELDLGTRIESLSRSGRQRLGIVQAFMHEPDLLLLDEPASWLEPRTRRESMAYRLAHGAQTWSSSLGSTAPRELSPMALHPSGHCSPAG